jgi:hypothetical protein
MSGTPHPYRAPQAPVPESQRDERLKQLAERESMRDRLAANVADLDAFIEQQRATFQALWRASKGIDLSMHKTIGELGNIMSAVSATIESTRTTRHIVWNEWNKYHADAERIREKIG